MKNNDLAFFLSEILVPIGFKRKGNSWVKKGISLTKLVKLQKSNFGNSYYINYGYIINSLPLGNMVMHVFNGVSSVDSEERKKIMLLLDLDSIIPKEQRFKELNAILHDKLIVKLQSVNNEEDLFAELKKRPHLNDVTLSVKKHLNLL